MHSQAIKPDWPAPGRVIAVSTVRQGGCSSPPFDSLNLAHHVGDADTAVAANRAILADLLPAGARVQWLSQVHGNRVVPAGQGDRYPQADACWSREPGRACAVLTADCLPVLFCSASGDVVAAAHAGWRGLLQGVLESAVAAMGVPPETLLAWLGPAIGPRAFEVGPEVRSSFLEAAFPGEKAAVAACFTPWGARPDHYFANLYALARLRLSRAGLRQVTGGDCCTFTDSKRFFSYRRDGQTGRMASVILCNPG
jgi:purine-nucleoside/S-methyl-5'-thioadenosine phosphorylase / adenosine deaminase